MQIVNHNGLIKFIQVKCFKYNTVLVLLNLENIDGRTKISNRQLHTEPLVENVVRSLFYVRFYRQ